jgi:hypothetical protein
MAGLAADSGCGKSTFMRRVTACFGGERACLCLRAAMACVAALRTPEAHALRHVASPVSLPCIYLLAAASATLCTRAFCSLA